MSHQNQHKSVNEIIEQFRQAMAVAGVPYSGTIVTDTDEIQRVTVDGDPRNSLNGWYKLFTDGIPAGAFGCWKRGVEVTWCCKEASELTPTERAAIEKRRKESDERRKKAEAARYAAAADKAAIIWEASNDCQGHPYLTAKGVRSYGLRIGRWTKLNDQTGEVWLDVPNALLVPVRDGKKLVGLQAIFPEKSEAIGRNKDFLSGAKKRGCFYAIGKPAENDNTPTVYICEGYATGASIHEATGNPVIVAFDAGNLKPVAERIRARYPQGRLVIAADNDRWTTQPVENPGVHFGRIAAKEIGATLVIPEFTDLTNRPTDFNDLHATEGLEAVLAQLQPKPTPAPAALPPANDNAPTQHLPALPANDVAAVDWYSPFPDFNGKGKPLATIENVAEACRRLGVTVRYNVIKKDIEILIPGQAFSIDNKANASLAWLASACNRFNVPTGPLGDFLCYMADQNLYNPVVNWITSKPWDGQSRLQDLYDTIQSQDEPLKEILLKRWLVSAVAGAFKPNGISAHGVLVLQGDQYLGKTKWFKTLVPAEFGIIQDGLMLRPDDRDSVKQVVSYWLVELGELDATFRKSDIAQLKSFLTRDKDVIRRAYAKMESEYARRTVFFASVNPREFLHDQTGNRRYWTIEAKWIDHSHCIDMQQLWAEVYELWKNGEPYYLSEHEMAMLTGSNEEFVVIDPIQDRINSRLNWAADHAYWLWRSSTDILLDVGIDRPTQSDATRAAAYIRQKNGNKGKRTTTGRMLWCPPKVVQY